MKRLITVSIIAAVSLIGCAKNSTASTDTPSKRSAYCQDRNLAGGWQASKMTPEVQKAVDTMLQQMNNSSPLKTIDEIRTQVVSGMNYAFEFTLENGEVWHGVVYRNIRGDYMVEQVAEQGKLCE